jgi:hypothetical protein
MAAGLSGLSYALAEPPGGFLVTRHSRYFRLDHVRFAEL